jgi:hypothetical protein
MDVKEIEREGMERIQLTQDRVGIAAGSCKLGLRCVKDGKTSLASWEIVCCKEILGLV